MEAPTLPFLCVLRDCNVRYRGRARAEQSGGKLAVVVKADGAVVAHSLDEQVSPQFYNPGGEVPVWTRLDHLYVRSRSGDGEVLKINGVPEIVHTTGAEGVSVARPEGTWKDLRRISPSGSPITRRRWVSQTRTRAGRKLARAAAWT